MFLSGLQSIDFQGIGSLGGDMSDIDLFNRFRNSLPRSKPGVLYGSAEMSDDSIRNIMSAVLGTYEIRKIQIPEDTAEGIAASVQRIILATDPTNVPAYKNEITGVVTKLKNDGFSLVPKDYPTQQTNASAAPQQSDSAAYRGAIAAQQAGSPNTQTQPAPTQQSPASSSAPQIQPRQPRSVNYKRVPYKQTAAEKQRLIWLIGGFGVLFAIAIGAIASRD